MATKVNVISYGERKGMYMEGTTLKGQLFNLKTTGSVSADADASEITSGESMFHGNLVLASFTAELTSLTNGRSMFYNCPKLSLFTSELPNLTAGNNMFYMCSSLASFTSELPNLTDGSNMFDGCKAFTSWTVELPNLTNGYYMFSTCPKLSSFNSVLSALNTAAGMFHGCKLNNESLQNIVTTIKSWSSGTHKITIGVNSNLVTQAQQDEADTILTGKGWTVTWERN